MSESTRCERHAWASVGVVVREGAVCRVWECERCPVWTLEPFDPADEHPVEDTRIVER